MPHLSQTLSFAAAFLDPVALSGTCPSQLSLLLRTVNGRPSHLFLRTHPFAARRAATLLRLGLSPYAFSAVDSTESLIPSPPRPTVGYGATTGVHALRPLLRQTLLRNTALTVTDSPEPPPGRPPSPPLPQGLASSVARCPFVQKRSTDNHEHHPHGSGHRTSQVVENGERRKRGQAGVVGKPGGGNYRGRCAHHLQQSAASARPRRACMWMYTACVLPCSISWEKACWTPAVSRMLLARRSRLRDPGSRSCRRHNAVTVFRPVRRRRIRRGGLPRKGGAEWLLLSGFVCMCVVKHPIVSSCVSAPGRCLQRAHRVPLRCRSLDIVDGPRPVSLTLCALELSIAAGRRSVEIPRSAAWAPRQVGCDRQGLALFEPTHRKAMPRKV